MQSVLKPSSFAYNLRSSPWFKDGNIVLQTEGVQFKVYRGILAANSSIFKDLFECGQGEEQLVENCHVVQLSDKADDLRIVLLSLHDCKLFKGHANKEEKIPVNNLIAYLRLGRKYDIAHLSELAMSKLALEYPTTLEARQHIIATTSIRSWPRFIDIDQTRREHFLMVNIIREHNIHQHLPYALYICASADPKDPFEREPWSLFSPNPEKYNSDARYLSPVDHLACMRGQKIMNQLLFDETYAWLKAGDTCNRLKCAAFKSSLLLRFVSPMKLGYAFLAWAPQWEHKLCPTCITLCKNRHNYGAQNVWNQLPAIFGLPPWEELSGTKA